MGWRKGQKAQESGYPKVANYSALLAQYPVASNVDKTVQVCNAQGVRLFSFKDAGFYYCNGSTWNRLGNTPEFFRDSNFQIYNDADNTKTLKVDCSALPTGQVSTLKVPYSGDVVVNKILPPVSNVVNYDFVFPIGMTCMEIHIPSMDIANGAYANYYVSNVDTTFNYLMTCSVSRVYYNALDADPPTITMTKPAQATYIESKMAFGHDLFIRFTKNSIDGWIGHIKEMSVSGLFWYETNFRMASLSVKAFRIKRTSNYTAGKGIMRWW